MQGTSIRLCKPIGALASPTHTLILPASYVREEQLREDLAEEREVTRRLEKQLLDAEQAVLALRFDRENDKLELRKLQRHIEALQAGGTVATIHPSPAKDAKERSKSKLGKAKTPVKNDESESKYIAVIERLRRVVQKQQHQIKQLQQKSKTPMRARQRTLAPRPKSAGAGIEKQENTGSNIDAKNILVRIKTLEKEKAQAEEQATQEQLKLKQQQARLRRELREQKKAARTARDAAAKLVDELGLARAEIERSEQGKLQREVVQQLRDETKSLRRENHELTEEVY